ncbi:peptidase associated/transthyretin-like domain-containing protein [Aquimarina intermedia]|nr:carboxypeptidase-like regulatory domain-containing protein [Aquimarina intermedia]
MQILRGTIMEQGSHKPVFEAIILLNKEDSYSKDIAQVSNSKGHFKYPNLPKGRYMLVIVHDEYRKKKKSFFYNGGIKEIQIILEKK